MRNLDEVQSAELASCGRKRLSMTSLFVNFYRDPDPARQQELDECLRRNLENPHIDRVVLLSQGQPPISAAKLVVVPISARPTYRRFFEAINAVSGASDINIVSNSDIFFDHTLGLIGAIDLRNCCLALTRWDVGPDGNSRPLGWQNSQDAWIFRGHVKWVDDASYRLGTPACDWRIAAELKQAKYDLLNPSRDLQAHHLHLSQVRRHSASDFVHGDHADVPICGAADIASQKDTAGVISFSLFGDDPRYTTGAAENILLARFLYPGWICRFYVDASVPRACIRQAREMGADVIEMPKESDPLQGMFWRLLVMDDDAFPRWIVRDVDSRLGYRERCAVDEWIRSGLPFHVLRDHPWQCAAIGGGLFGGSAGHLPRMTETILNWKRGFYGADQDFLSREIYPRIKDQMLLHDSFAASYTALVRPFPTPYEDLRFVGERISTDGAGWAEDRRALAEALERRSRSS
jgi:hypothetical protein